jgi:hypothetical protein
MQIIAGKTDVSISIYARALSGAALTGKTAADFALTYRRAGANVALSLSDLASIDAAHTDGGIYEVGNGEYRLDLPDAAVATGANQVSVTGTVDGGVLLGYPIQLDAERTPGGAYTQTVTVTCGGVTIPNATVEILSGAVTIDRQTTNASGVATPTCNAGTYTLRVTATGYASSTATITVTGAAVRPVTLTALGVPAPTVPGTLTAYGYCYAYGCTAKPAVTVSAPVWYDGSRYKVRRGASGAWSEEFLPTPDTVGGTSYLMPGFLGHE